MVRASFPSFVLREFHLHRSLRGAEGGTREQNMEFLPSTSRVGSQEERRGLWTLRFQGGSHWLEDTAQLEHPFATDCLLSFAVATASDVTNGPE